MLNFTQLPLLSYLRIDESYEAPTQMLEEVVDQFGDQFTLRSSHQGGLKQLRGYLRHRENQKRLDELRLGEAIDGILPSGWQAS